MQTCLTLLIAVSLIHVATANRNRRSIWDTTRCKVGKIPLIGHIAGHFLSHKVCCPEVGCFEACGDFSHLPLPQCVEDYGIKFHLYTQATQDTPTTVDRSTEIPSEFDPSVRTIFIIHGWTEAQGTPWLQPVKDLFLEQGAANVFLVEWEEGADELYYPQSASNTRTAGAEVALLTDRLKQELDVSPSLLWCIGFSLGAHTCGYAGKKTKFGHITGLDPAGPWFDMFTSVSMLTHTDADFVDVIHTDGASSITPGALLEMGHIDFYPNRGKNQPGCSILDYEGVYDSDESIAESLTQNAVTCSHYRATAYFMESFGNAECFKATYYNCKDRENLPESCMPCTTKDTCPQMGVNAIEWFKINGKSDKTMKAYLETNSAAPYCK